MVLLGWTTASLWAAASLILALPPLAGIRAAQKLQIFRKEAFGHYRAATTAILIALGLGVMAYTLLVVNLVLHVQSGTIGSWPLSIEAVLLCVQSITLSASILGVLAVGTHLRRIVEPDS